MGGACVDDAGDAAAGGRGDCVGVLLDALADLAAGDEHEGVGASEGSVQACGAREVDDGGRYSQARDDRESLGVASGGNDVLGGGAAGDEPIDDEASEVAGGTGDDKRRRHWGSLRSVLVIGTNPRPGQELPLRWYAP